MNDSRRPKRIAGMIEAEVSRILNERIEDPFLKVVRVSEVEISSDLKLARVYVGGHGGQEISPVALKHLERARPFIRRQIGVALKLRVVPDLRFVADRHDQNVQRLMGIFHELESTSC